MGVEDAQAEAEFVSQAIRDRIDPVPPFEVSVEAEDGRSVLVVTVPEGGDTPYYYHADGRPTQSAHKSRWLSQRSATASLLHRK